MTLSQEELDQFENAREQLGFNYIFGKWFIFKKSAHI